MFAQSNAKKQPFYTYFTFLRQKKTWEMEDPKLGSINRDFKFKSLTEKG